MASHSTNDLHPAFKPVAEDILTRAQAALDEKFSGSRVFPLDTWRERADQAAAKASGASQWDISWHEFGLGIDYGIKDEHGNYVTNGEDPRYRLVGEIGTAHGCIWGGNWRKPDWDHLEWHPNFTLAIYQAWLAAHRFPE